jgi:hypothetical protein
VSHNTDPFLIFGIWNIVQELNKLSCTKYDDRACVLVYCRMSEVWRNVDHRAVF